MAGYELKSGLENIKNFFKRVLRLKIAIRTTAIKMKHIVEEKKRYRYAEVIFTSVYKKKKKKWQIKFFTMTKLTNRVFLSGDRDR